MAEAVADRGVGELVQLPRPSPGEGASKTGRGRAKITRICIRKNMWGAQSGNLAPRNQKPYIRLWTEGHEMLFM